MAFADSRPKKTTINPVQARQIANGCNTYFDAKGLYKVTPGVACSANCVCAREADFDTLNVSPGDGSASMVDAPAANVVFMKPPRPELL